MELEMPPVKKEHLGLPLCVSQGRMSFISTEQQQYKPWMGPKGTSPGVPFMSQKSENTVFIAQCPLLRTQVTRESHVVSCDPCSGAWPCSPAISWNPSGYVFHLEENV